MSFKSEASKVKANIAAGNYKEKTDVFAGFFDELTYGIKKQDEAKRQEDLEKKRESRINAREILKEQKKADEIEKEQNRLANFYFKSNPNVQPTTANRSKLVGVIKSGNYNNLADLESYMSSRTTYIPGVSPAQDVAPGEVPFDMLDTVGENAQTQDIINNKPSDGSIEFTGKKPADISEFFKGIKTEQDLNAKISQINAMPNGALKDQYLAELSNIKNEGRFEDKSGDDIFRNSDGSFKTSAEIQIIGRDSKDPEIKKRALALTSTSIDPALMSRDDLVSKIALMKSEQASEEALRPFTIALEAKNALRTSDGATETNYTTMSAVNLNSVIKDMERENSLNALEPPHSTAEIDRLKSILEGKEDYTEVDADPLPYMVNTITTGNIADFTANVETELGKLNAIADEDLNEEQLLQKITLLNRQAIINKTSESFKKKTENNDLNLTDQIGFVTVKSLDDDGNEIPDSNVELYLTMTDDGRFYDTETGKYYSTDEIVSQSPTQEEFKNSISAANQLNKTFTQPLLDLRTSSTTVIETALALDKFVQDNPQILTTIGGAGSELVIKIGQEIDALVDLLSGQDLSTSEFETRYNERVQQIANKAVGEYTSGTPVADNAAAFSQWTALNYRHAFAFAKLALDSSGQALSNYDFKNALTINNVGSTYQTYTKNIRTQTGLVVSTANKKYNEKLKNNPQHLLAMNLRPYKTAFEATNLDVGIDEYLVQNNPVASSWLASEPVPINGGGSASSSVEQKGVGVNSYFNNSASMERSQAVYNDILSFTDATQREKFFKSFYELRAKIMFGTNYTPEQLSQTKTMFDAKFGGAN
jgi:hypothetical protein